MAHRPQQQSAASPHEVLHSLLNPWVEGTSAKNRMHRAEQGSYGAIMLSTYPPLNVKVRTPVLTLAGATDDMLERLIPVVRDGVVRADEAPFDDPMSLYQD